MRCARVHVVEVKKGLKVFDCILGKGSRECDGFRQWIQTRVLKMGKCIYQGKKKFKLLKIISIKIVCMMQQIMIQSGGFAGSSTSREWSPQFGDLAKSSKIRGRGGAGGNSYLLIQVLGTQRQYLSQNFFPCYSSIP